MAKWFQYFAGVCLIGCLTAGCTRVTWIHSTPPGALVRINNEEVGHTPVAYKSKRGLPKRFRIQVEKEGFKPADFYLDSTMSWGLGYAGAISLVPLFWAWSLQKNVAVSLKPVGAVLTPSSVTP
jgi:hypothetical protein